MSAFGMQETLLGDKEKLSIPFTDINGFIVVDVVIQNKLYQKMILDTGAEHTILFPSPVINILQLPTHKKIRVQGADLRSDVFANVTNGVKISLANTSTVPSNMIILEENSFDFSQYLGTEVTGIIGMELFKSLILQIDYKKNLVTLYDPSRFRPESLKNHVKFPIKIVDNKPYIRANVLVSGEKMSTSTLLLDTGAGMTAMLHNNTDTTLTLPEKVVKGSIGKGISGDVEGFSGKIRKLEFAGLQFSNLITHFQALDSTLIIHKKIVRNGIIGNQVLSRLDFYIDFLNETIYIKPNKDYNKNFEFDRSGITIFSFGPDLNQYYVKYVLENSPADEADIRPGDVIKKVGFWNFRVLSLKYISRKLSDDIGKKVTLTIERDGKKMKKFIILRELL